MQDLKAIGSIRKAEKYKGNINKSTWQRNDNRINIRKQWFIKKVLKEKCNVRGNFVS